MKKNLDIRLYLLPLLLMVVALLPACKKNTEGSNPPVITAVRTYVHSPNDTVLTSAVPTSQWVVITGQNLKTTTRIEFDGVPATFNSVLFADKSLVVQIPGIKYSTVDTSKLYTVKVTTAGGVATFNFKLGPPAAVVWGLSDAFAAPGDSVYLFGGNLLFVKTLTYAGLPVLHFNTTLSGDTIGFVMPSGVQSTKQVVVTTKGFTATYTITTNPVIYGISYVNPKLGDSVYIYGAYLKGIQSISFGGATITNFTEGPRGASVKFSAPDENSYSSGPVTIVTSSGTAATVNKVNTQNNDKVGLLGDFEWGDNFGFGWAPNENLNGPWNTHEFDGSMGKDYSQFMSIDNPVLAGGASAFFPLGSSNTGNHWVPVANITDPPANWAFQFDISVAKPWKGGTLLIKTRSAGDKFVARYEPWKNSKAAFQTKGWETVTIPLSEFRSTVDQLGDGGSLIQISDLLGSTGAGPYDMYLENFSTSPTATGFYVAIDNIRCVKIK
ncbi:MAG: glycan-binding surface protein [Bacteroidota bacterium]|nr:glycan-binding surface protein [Bacteroidota bacterium]